MQDEQALGLKLPQSLDRQQQARAILNPNKTGNHRLAQDYQDH